MATSKLSKAPLEVLQQMLNEVLIQTGKSLRSNDEGARKLASASNAPGSKSSETMTTYFYALDTLETEIINAKSVLMRDLEKLQAAKRAAAEPKPEPVAPPAPMMEMEMETNAPPAFMDLEFPSTAAHTIAIPTTTSPQLETRPTAPFPDMGMDMGLGMTDDATNASADASEKVKSSPMVAPGSIKTEPKPSPIAPSAKVTPVPTPQMSQMQQQKAQVQANRQPSISGPSQPTPTTAAATIHDSNNFDSMLSLPGDEANVEDEGGSVDDLFTDMEFSLAPTDGDAQNAQNAPQAPMPEFDLTTFAPTDANGGDLLNLENFQLPTGTNQLGGGGAPTANMEGISLPITMATMAAPVAAMTTTTGVEAAPKPEAEPSTSDVNLNSSNIDDLFSLDDANATENMDLDLDLSGAGGPHDNTFDDMMFENTDDGMGQFDNAYFGLE